MSSDIQFPRHVRPLLVAAMADTRVVALTGPRQSGKTTLARHIAAERGMTFLSLDDAQTRQFALSDPTGLLRGQAAAVIDEIQRAPDLILSIKQSVDEDTRPGRFLITGLADLFGSLATPDSLAGRIERLELLPLSQRELTGRGPSNLLDSLFAGQPLPQGQIGGTPDLVERVLAGGFPGALGRSGRRRQDWLKAYAMTLAQRDVLEIAGVRKPVALGKLLLQIAPRTAQLIQPGVISGVMGLDQKTVDRWIGLLETLFLVARIPGWHRNDLKRLVKSPKLHFLDSGVAAAVRGIDARRIERDRVAFGPLLETFVFAEIRKLAASANQPVTISHYRDKWGQEVDLVLESPDQSVVGIEVKAGATVIPDDLKGLKQLAADTGERFIHGIVLHDGDRIMRLNERMTAAPVSLLWEL